MRSIIVGALLAASLAAPAYAQKSKDLSPMQQLDENKKREAQSVDQQYQRTLKYTGKNVEPVKTDPWMNMRAPTDPKTKK